MKLPHGWMQNLCYCGDSWPFHSHKLYQLFRSKTFLLFYLPCLCKSNDHFPVSTASDREPWLVHSLVDYYYTTHSRSVISICTELRDPHDKVWITDYICDVLRTLGFQRENRFFLRILQPLIKGNIYLHIHGVHCG